LECPVECYHTSVVTSRQSRLSFSKDFNRYINHLISKRVPGYVSTCRIDTACCALRLSMRTHYGDNPTAKSVHEKTVNSCMSFRHLTKAYWGEFVGVIDLFPRSPIITTPEGFCFRSRRVGRGIEHAAEQPCTSWSYHVDPKHPPP
jgi:hypothetical protein